MTARTVLEALKTETQHVADAQAAARSGAVVHGLRHRVSAEELLRVYAIRAEHVAGKATPFAAGLAAELRELCAVLAAQPTRSVTILRIAESSGRRFNFFLDADTTELLGSTITYNARALSPERFRELWGHDRAD